MEYLLWRISRLDFSMINTKLIENTWIAAEQYTLQVIIHYK